MLFLHIRLLFTINLSEINNESLANIELITNLDYNFLTNYIIIFLVIMFAPSYIEFNNFFAFLLAAQIFSVCKIIKLEQNILL